MKAILTDITKCIGCRECVAACHRVNGMEPDSPRRWSSDDGLSARNWTSIVEREGQYVRKQCRHCIEPACVSVCPVQALTRNQDGAVVYDSGRCMGCRYCMMACPFGIPRYDWDKLAPLVRKCILCTPRLADGKQPACTEVCPTHATIFGEREALLAEAKRRISEQPDLYINRIWGESELGGTSVLYISNINLDFLTYGSRPPEKPLPQTTVTAMEAVPFAFIGMAGLMTGLHWFFKRREEVAGKEGDGESTGGGNKESGDAKSE